MQQYTDSPASNGGRGLKRGMQAVRHPSVRGFARQQWRAWIETSWSKRSTTALAGFARQQWRAWIET